MTAKLALVLLGVLSLALAPVSPEGAEGSEKLSPRELVEDFRVARSALEEGHSGIYRYTPKAELDRIFAAAERSLARPLDAWGLYRVLAPAVAAIKCGHTEVALPEKLQAQISDGALALLPLRVKVIAGVPYVFRDLSTPAGALAGLEIRSVNGIPATRLVATMMAAVSGDGDIASAREVRIGDWSFASNLVGLLGMRAPYRVALRDPVAGKAVEVTLAGMGMPEILAASKARYPGDEPAPGAGDFALLDGGRIGRLTVRSFWGSTAAGQDLPALFAESFAALRDKGSATLILDVRGNGGGYDELGQILLSYLLDKPFRYYDDLILNKASFGFEKYGKVSAYFPGSFFDRRADGKLHAVRHPNWGLKAPRSPGFRGRVLVLQDGGSFSTTAEFLSQLHGHHRATFVGEESGGGYRGNTSGNQATVVLPHSRIAVDIPLMTYVMAVRGSDAAHGVRPDLPVARTIADWIQGRDPALERALALARTSSPSSRTGNTAGNESAPSRI